MVSQQQQQQQQQQQENPANRCQNSTPSKPGFQQKY